MVYGRGQLYMAVMEGLLRYTIDHLALLTWLRHSKDEVNK